MSELALKQMCVTSRLEGLLPLQILGGLGAGHGGCGLGTCMIIRRLLQPGDPAAGDPGAFS